jgi:hypothetical protein
MKRSAIGPAWSRLGEDLGSSDFFVPSHSNDSLWWTGRLQADFSHQLDDVSTDTLVRLASGLSGRCVKKQRGLAGSCFGGYMAPTFATPKSIVAMQRWDKTNSQLQRKRAKNNLKK